MLDVLVYLFEQYYEQEDNWNEHLLEKKLQAAGFESNDISEALNWLTHLENDLEGHTEALASSSSIRLFSDIEKNKLSPDCQGFILFLETAGAISAKQREHIIDRIMSFAGHIGIEQMKLMVLMILWRSQSRLDSLLIEELLYSGEPPYLH